MGFPGDSVVKSLPANAGDAGEGGSISRLERYPGGGNDGILAWRIPWAEKLGGLSFTGSQRVRHGSDWAHLHKLRKRLTDLENELMIAYVKWSEVAQSCPTLRDPMDCNLPDFSVHGIFPARVLEWVSVSFSRGSSWPWDWTWVICIAGRLFTIWVTREFWEA